MTFQEQCMTVVFPRFIEGINAANRKVGTLTSEVAQLQAKVAELEVQLADAIDRVNMLEAKAAEKKPRKPRAKKQADPVQMVEQAAQDAQVKAFVTEDGIVAVAADSPEAVAAAMDEVPF